MKGIKEKMIETKKFEEEYKEDYIDKLQEDYIEEYEKLKQKYSENFIDEDEFIELKQKYLEKMLDKYVAIFTFHSVGDDPERYPNDVYVDLRTLFEQYVAWYLRDLEANMGIDEYEILENANQALKDILVKIERVMDYDESGVRKCDNESIWEKSNISEDELERVIEILRVLAGYEKINFDPDNIFNKFYVLLHVFSRALEIKLIHPIRYLCSRRWRMMPSTQKFKSIEVNYEKTT